ncbi:MAG: hypothetical protein CMO30_15135 [Tistrella sp.]|uniref:hypothetical protein n=1 Tax=Tistrella sp. TaxID=2024861 RepID=UPI000C674A55|nr:hypothetical protein [Tistrella sp.]MAD38579.1 hypothetical protein [Tistrella sp.]MBA75357.1 hypothetical protein [Tistrella sp.]MBA76602.1 hypothetical protein [Tistrella sp.]|tara:strand:+ start:4892 stop:5134 length:243 start_codon:yes stop_codon:yes gene_type:complete
MIDLREARRRLGELWGLDRPLSYSELGRALRLSGRKPGDAVRQWEQDGVHSGPVDVALHYMLQGYLPPDDITVIAPKHRP